jgi:hypothetical protein
MQLPRDRRVNPGPTNKATFLDQQVPRVDHKAQHLTGRSLTIAGKKRARLEELYHQDSRVTPWTGTAQGVLQAVNTYEHHDITVRGAERSERNMLRSVTGQFGKLDRDTWRSLSAILIDAT